MPKVVYNRLTNKEVANLKLAGFYPDGGGLYLQITGNQAKSWVFRFRYAGKRPEMGLGSYPIISLKDAREKAAVCREYVAEGKSPLINNPFTQAQKQSTTFEKYALDWVEKSKSQWINEKHIEQWKKSVSGKLLTDKKKKQTNGYAVKLANMDIATIDTPDILEAILPIWKTKPETAKRTLNRWKRILDAARVDGLRSGQNPAMWDGHLEHLLPPPKKLIRGHLKALPYSDIQDFISHLSNLNSFSAAALYFTIITCVRSGEALGARKYEFDLDNNVWNIPAARMKMKRPFAVPLPTTAIKLINELTTSRQDNEFVFSAEGKKPLSNMAMLMCLRGLLGDKSGYTVHGFRSSFRDWAYNETNFSREVVEACLAHAVGDKTEQAYRRSDALERRRKIMQAWDNNIHHIKAKSNIIEFKR